jgi:hypothetical protein
MLSTIQDEPLSLTTLLRYAATLQGDTTVVYLWYSAGMLTRHRSAGAEQSVFASLDTSSLKCSLGLTPTRSGWPSRHSGLAVHPFRSACRRLEPDQTRPEPVARPGVASQRPASGG